MSIAVEERTDTLESAAIEESVVKEAEALVAPAPRPRRKLNLRKLILPAAATPSL